MVKRLLLLAITLGTLQSGLAFAVDDRYTATTQIGAFAPNAGGQTAYSLRLAQHNWEAGVFSNQYVIAGDYPLTGGSLDWRFPICDTECFWQFFVQVGGGLTNGGPLAEVTWGMIIPALPIWLPTSAPKYIPQLRIDITTQLIFIRYRAVTWSYPLWIGLSVPF